MKKIAFRFFALAMFAGLCTSYSFAEKIQTEQGLQITSGPIPKPGMSEEAYSGFNISCDEQLQPNRVVISGGLSAESISPKDGSTQLEKQMSAIRAYVESKGGIFIEKERLRAARNPEKANDGSMKMPYIQVQRIEAEFPINAHLDELIEKLFKLGLDRYGKDAGIDAYSSREYKNISFYRIAKQDEQLAAAVSRCMHKEAPTTCPNLAPESCVAKMKLVSAYAQTGSIVTAEAYRNTLHLLLIKQSVPQKVEPIETIGTQSITLQMTIDGRIAREATNASATQAGMGKKGEE